MPRSWSVPARIALASCSAKPYPAETGPGATGATAPSTTTGVEVDGYHAAPRDADHHTLWLAFPYDDRGAELTDMVELGSRLTSAFDLSDAQDLAWEASLRVRSCSRARRRVVARLGLVHEAVAPSARGERPARPMLYRRTKNHLPLR